MAPRPVSQPVAKAMAASSAVIAVRPGVDVPSMLSPPAPLLRAMKSSTLIVPCWSGARPY